MIPSISNLQNLHSANIKQLQSELGIIATNEEWDKSGCYQTTPKSFDYLVIRDNKVFRFVNNVGGRFRQACKGIFAELKPKDQVHFINIIADSPIRKNEHLTSIKLVMK